jgi:hypothetical protein
MTSAPRERAICLLRAEWDEKEPQPVIKLRLFTRGHPVPDSH